MVGVRCYELHPNGHGLHVHVVVVGRFPAATVWKLARRYGWGHTDVVRVHGACVADYLGGYLRKAGRTGALRGRRLWACFGFEGHLVSNVCMQSELSDTIRSRCFDCVGLRVWLASRGEPRVTVNSSTGAGALLSVSCDWPFSDTRGVVGRIVQGAVREWWSLGGLKNARLGDVGLYGVHSLVGDWSSPAEPLPNVEDESS